MSETRDPDGRAADDPTPNDENVIAETAASSRQRTSARFALGAIVSLALLCVLLTFSPWRQGFADIARGDPPDWAGYYGAIERMRAGDTYYEALGAELHTRGYPTTSPFNWRTPGPLVVLAKLPSPDWGRIGIAILGGFLLFFGHGTLREMGGRWTVGLGLVLLSGTIVPGLVGALFVQPVLWAGLLVGLSAVLLGAGHRRSAVAVGVLAPFCREFAIAWVVVCLAFALREGRRREAAAWGLGVAGFGLMLAYHAVQVGRHLTPESFGQPEGWFQFGGLPFLISTFQMSGFFLLVPQWGAALLLAAALAGTIGWTSPVGRRVSATLFIFVLSFSIIGLRYNQYWGLVLAPLVCLCAARAPVALGALWGVAEPGARSRPDAEELQGA
ncbi:MAG: hypothetical protein R3195_20020 [Gemmatimonadota bacterium]|nr:hypothetical protein [Gemmatimonadota bacterium]